MSVAVFIDIVADRPQYIQNSEAFQLVVNIFNTKTQQLASLLGSALDMTFINCNTLLQELTELDVRQRLVLNHLANPGRVQFRLLLYALMREVVERKKRVVFCNYLQDVWDAVYANHLFPSSVRVLHFLIMNDDTVRQTVLPGMAYDELRLKPVPMPMDTTLLFCKDLDTSTPERLVIDGLVHVQSNAPPLVNGMMAQVAVNCPFQTLWLLLKLYECRFASYNRRSLRAPPRFLQMRMSSYSFMYDKFAVVDWMRRQVDEFPVIAAVASDSLPLVDRRQRFEQLPPWLLVPEHHNWRTAWCCGDHTHHDFALLEYYELFQELVQLNLMLDDKELRLHALNSGSVPFVQAVPLVEHVFFALFDERKQYHYTVNTMPALASNSSCRALVMIANHQIVAFDRACNVVKLVRQYDLANKKDRLLIPQHHGTLLDCRVQCDPHDRSLCVTVLDVVQWRYRDMTAQTLDQRQHVVAQQLMPVLARLQKAHNKDRVHERVHFLRTVYKRVTCGELLRDMRGGNLHSLFFVPQRCPYGLELQLEMFEWRNSPQLYLSLYYRALDHTLNTWDSTLSLPAVLLLPSLPNYQTVDVLLSQQFVRDFARNRADLAKLPQALTFLRVQRHSNLSDTTDIVALRLYSSRLTLHWLQGKLSLLAALLN